MTEDKKQKIMLGAIAVLVLGAGSAWYFSRDTGGNQGTQAVKKEGKKKSRYADGAGQEKKAKKKRRTTVEKAKARTTEKKARKYKERTSKQKKKRRSGKKRKHKRVFDAPMA